MQIDRQYQNTTLQTAAVIGGCLLLFLLAVFAYFPGLNGPFVVDDFGTIETLGDFGGVRDWTSFKAFVLGGTAGPTGRPIALLSFLIDGSNWPADPWPFKRTNLIIHLLNAALLGVLISKIMQLLEVAKRDAHWIALVAAAVWMLHPFLVSTTLYVVQRMAQLSTLFVFAGLIGYLQGRSRLSHNAKQAYLIMSLSIAAFTLLAMLSKENGILLPLLVGVIEFTVIASQQHRLPTLQRSWAGVFIIAPSVVIVTYLLVNVFTHDFFNIVPPRDFSIFERVLTQPRILADYLQNWFIPKLYTTGVFQDHFIKSTGLFSPLTTLPSLLLHIAIISLAIVKRRKWPLFSLAALFFYAGHLLESTVLNLELYFEHRNYLPASLLFVPIIAFLWRKFGRLPFAGMALGLLLLLGGFTRYSATVWTDFSSMAEASARKAPTSARAQADYAKALFNSGRYQESLQVIDRAIAVNPVEKPQLQLNRLIMLCGLGILQADDFGRVAKLLSATVYDPRLISIYNEFVSAAVQGRCGDISLATVRAMFVDMLQMPANADIKSQRYAQIKYFVGLVDTYNGASEQAVREFEDSLAAQSSAKTAMNMAALLATNGYFEEALYFSELALSALEKSPEGLLRAAGVSAASIRGFQAIVRADLAAGQADDTSRPGS